MIDAADADADVDAAAAAAADADADANYFLLQFILVCRGRSFLKSTCFDEQVSGSGMRKSVSRARATNRSEI